MDIKRGEAVLRKASEVDRSILMNYLNKEASINLFMLSDIERFGFESEFQELWIQYLENEIGGVLLRYHDTFILASNTKMDYEEVVDLLSHYTVGVISGKQALMDDFYPLVEDQYTYKSMQFAELTNKERLIPCKLPLKEAQKEDAMKIAEAYGQVDAFKSLYSQDVNQRYQQILNRITSGEGRHYFYKEKEQILCHGNTAAESESAAMLGGVFTLEGVQRQSYARQLVSELCRKLLDEGKKVCLFYSGEGPEALFKGLGFKDIDKWIVLGGKNE